MIHTMSIIGIILVLHCPLDIAWSWPQSRGIGQCLVSGDGQ